MDDFIKFLSTQEPVLDLLEASILQLEKGEMQNSPATIKRLLHTIKGESGFLALAEVEAVCHMTEDLLMGDLTTKFADVLLKVKDWLSETFSLYAGGTGKPDTSDEILGMLTDYQNKVSPTPGPRVLEPGMNAAQGPATDQQQIDKRSTVLKDSITIDLERLDSLIDTIGELAITESMITGHDRKNQHRSMEFKKSLKALTAITRELQSMGIDLRMIPLKGLFNRMARVARDLAQKSGKTFEFIIRGETTKLDKSLVDGLNDPLMHIIRNCVDHGIEKYPRDRLAAGKRESATIILEAYQQGGDLHIEISDDGQGIDGDRLVEKALKAGIIDDASALSHDEILNLIFQSGLSTAQTVTDISGRGVGMDVVQSRIASFEGSVTLQSQKGKGTRMLIKMPLTLAIVDGIFSRVGEETFVIPTLSVITSLKAIPEMVTRIFERQELLKFQNSLVPIIRLHRIFSIDGAVNDPCSGILVVVEASGCKAALLVDELIEKRSIVRKNLNLGNFEGQGFSGGAIMPDNTVGLILDISSIIALANESNK